MENTKQRLLSIYIPTYNRCEQVQRQVGFLLKEVAGLENKVEIIVSNNCSKDATEEYMLQFQNQIRYYKNETNIGIVKNLYRSVKYASGKYLWTIGDDDILEKGTVSHVVHLLESHQNLNLIFLNWTPLNDTHGRYQGSSGLLQDWGGARLN